MSDSLMHNWRPAQKRAAKGATRGASIPQPSKDYRPLLLKLVLLLLLLASLVAAGMWIRHQQLQNFTIRSIEITGSSEFVTSEQVSEVLQQHAEGDFFNIDIDVTRAALLALPWVREVSLRREWPDRLLIKLREQQAVAHWNAGGQQAALLNEQGQRFAGVKEVQGQNLPALSGPAGSEERVLTEYAQLQELLSAGQLQALSLDARNTWEMILQGGIQVRFLERNKDEAIQRLLTALRVFNADELQRAAKIDLRYSNGFAIEWSEKVNAKVEKKTHV